MQTDLKRIAKKYKLFPIACVLLGLVFLVLLNQTKKTQTDSIVICNSSCVDSIYEIKDSIVLPVLYQQVPDFREMHYKDRMEKFIYMMLPSVMLACEKMNVKRVRVLETYAAINQGIASESDSLFIKQLKKSYKTDNVDEVIKRLHPHPVSIILAQAAIESGWATSRFCREGNNIFGIWSYNSSEKRMKASESRGGNDIYLRRYDSLFESVYDYLETIARVNAYEQFREARLHSDNPYRLIWYLNNYSEKRYEYVHSLRNIIEFNDLHIYDHYQLAKIGKRDKIWNALLN